MERSIYLLNMLLQPFSFNEIILYSICSAIKIHEYVKEWQTLN